MAFPPCSTAAGAPDWLSLIHISDINAYNAVAADAHDLFFLKNAQQPKLDVYKRQGLEWVICVPSATASKKLPSPMRSSISGAFLLDDPTDVYKRQAKAHGV